MDSSEAPDGNFERREPVTDESGIDGIRERVLQATERGGRLVAPAELGVSSAALGSVAGQELAKLYRPHTYPRLQGKRLEVDGVFAEWFGAHVLDALGPDGDLAWLAPELRWSGTLSCF